MAIATRTPHPQQESSRANLAYQAVTLAAMLLVFATAVVL
jgi:hypothetical protein